MMFQFQPQPYQPQGNLGGIVANQPGQADEIPKTLQFGQYALDKELDSGAQGIVCLYRDTKTGKKVAIKLEPPNAGSRLSAANVVQESYFMSQFANKNCDRLAQYILHGQQNGRNFLVMEYLEDSLLQHIEKDMAKNKKTYYESVLDTAYQMIDAIAQMHKVTKQLHRDIKVENFRAHKGKIYLIDFGLTCEYMRGTQHIQEENFGNSFVGTYDYAPIRTFDGKNLSRRDDMESIGYAILNLMVEGKGLWFQYQGKQEQTDFQRRNEILRLKKEFLSSEQNFFMKGIQNFLKACATTPFDQEPNYEALKLCLKQTFLVIEQKSESIQQKILQDFTQGQILKMIKKWTTVKQQFEENERKNQQLHKYMEENKKVQEEQLNKLEERTNKEFSDNKETVRSISSQFQQKFQQLIDSIQKQSQLQKEEEAKLKNRIQKLEDLNEAEANNNHSYAKMFPSIKKNIQTTNELKQSLENEIADHKDTKNSMEYSFNNHYQLIEQIGKSFNDSKSELTQQILELQSDFQNFRSRLMHSISSLTIELELQKVNHSQLKTEISTKNQQNQQQFQNNQNKIDECNSSIKDLRINYERELQCLKTEFEDIQEKQKQNSEFIIEYSTQFLEYKEENEKNMSKMSTLIENNRIELQDKAQQLESKIYIMEEDVGKAHSEINGSIEHKIGILQRIQYVPQVLYDGEMQGIQQNIKILKGDLIKNCIKLKELTETKMEHSIKLIKELSDSYNQVMLKQQELEQKWKEEQYQVIHKPGILREEKELGIYGGIPVFVAANPLQQQFQGSVGSGKNSEGRYNDANYINRQYQNAQPFVQQVSSGELSQNAHNRSQQVLVPTPDRQVSNQMPVNTDQQIPNPGDGITLPHYATETLGTASRQIGTTSSSQSHQIFDMQNATNNQ